MLCLSFIERCHRFASQGVSAISRISTSHPLLYLLPNAFLGCSISRAPCGTIPPVKRGKGAAFAPFHAQLGPLQVTMARFYGIRAKETGQNLNGCTRIVNELPRLNRSIPDPNTFRSTRILCTCTRIECPESRPGSPGMRSRRARRARVSPAHPHPHLGYLSTLRHRHYRATKPCPLP